MVERLIEYSAKNRFIIFIFVLLFTVWGVWALRNVPLDAIPDLSDVQVILVSDWPGRSPDLVESQITYPIASSLLSAPKVKVVRGFSYFGISYVYVVFEDNTDIYWARTRVLEYLSKIKGKIPDEVKPVLGPDATGVGWVYQYALVDKGGRYNISELRSLQDWYLKYALEEVKGVAEVASAGGHVKEYQIRVDPNKLHAYGLDVMGIMEAVRANNRDVGGRVVEYNGREFMVRGQGYIRNIQDIENIVVSTNTSGSPLVLKDIAVINEGPQMRRGTLDLNGEGEVVGGIIVMRYGENALNVINGVKKKIADLKKTLPKGVDIVTAYDRSDLIYRAIDTLKQTLIEESIIVTILCIIFLFHFRSVLVAIITLPIAVLMSFIIFNYLGLTANIMSLSGIAIAIGEMVDAAIVMIENAHKHIEHNPELDRTEAIINAAKQVGSPLFFSLLVIAVSFIPVFTLEAQEGRLFKPLAFTKTFAMFFASFLSITLVPALMVIFIKGKIVPEDKNPISRILIFLYKPIVKFALRFRIFIILLAIASIAFSWPIFKRLGSEFMPALNEGIILYMPTTLPGISAQQASDSVQRQDMIIKKNIPEVDVVLGKAGRAETATDPAPFSMVETVIVLKPEDKWRPGMTWQKLVDEMDSMVKVPGWVNSWTMPIKARIDMLATGIKTPLGIKIFGADPQVLQKIGADIENLLKGVKGVRSVYAERTDGGYYIDIIPDRLKLARYGLNIEDVNTIIESSIGGMPITMTVEGRARYPVTVRYKRALHSDVEYLKSVLVPLKGMGVGHVPLGEIAHIGLRQGPDMLKEEDGMLTSYVYVDIGAGYDIGRVVEKVRPIVDEKISLPEGYRLLWSGQYEYMERAKKKLMLVVPLTLILIFILLYMSFHSFIETTIVLLSVPFALTGGLIYVYLQGYNMSVAVWVGFIALAGVASETGVVMIVYLNEVYEKRKQEGKLKTYTDLYDAVIEGAVQRLRPKIMTVGSTVAGLFPIMWSSGTGSEVMKRIAAPMIGGMVTSTVLTLIIIPVIYVMWKKRGLSK
ncbi:MAG: CusA/CzcA family heavy metal efflux RND transporter [Candidatus Magnetoovum sp. WYHC-5]|nr:CusA/CzcA family heavy metal efflux RND transporter [Candidatus Magnetoovum sp. WYHC-5]